MPPMVPILRRTANDPGEPREAGVVSRVRLLMQLCIDVDVEVNVDADVLM